MKIKRVEDVPSVSDCKKTEKRVQLKNVVCLYNCNLRRLWKQKNFKANQQCLVTGVHTILILIIREPLIGLSFNINI